MVPVVVALALLVPALLVPALLVPALLVPALLLVPAPVASAASPERATRAGCPGQSVPPGPPAREETVPVAPLPVPAEPVGGPGMGVCGYAHAAGVAPPPPIGVASYVVADLDSGAVLAVRAPHARERPASLLKLFTALVATSRLDPAQVVTASAEDANVDGSRAGIGPGGRYTVTQLLTGLLLNSGNDTASALARALGGIPATLTAMQDTARSLGALDTRPATPSGLDGPGMSSSAYDLALAFRAAVARPQIAQLMLTRTAPFPGFGGKPGFLLANDNPLLTTPGTIGGKTGFTDAARHTFVGAVDRNGRRLLVVLMRGEQRPVRMVDSARMLLDWGFAVPRTAAPVGTLVDPGTVPQGGASTPGTATPGTETPGASDGPTVDGQGGGLVAGALAVVAIGSVGAR
ncbi:MAG: serine hydrolase, partial [Pseudonocardia sp.]|nr:serine hydrolase [Pseudonocardia sp.]